MNKTERKEEIENLKHDIVMMGRMMDKWQPDIMTDEEQCRVTKYGKAIKNAPKYSKQELHACEVMRDFLFDNYFVPYGISPNGNDIIMPVRLAMYGCNPLAWHKVAIKF